MVGTCFTTRQRAVEILKIIIPNVTEEAKETKRRVTQGPTSMLTCVHGGDRLSRLASSNLFLSQLLTASGVIPTTITPTITKQELRRVQSVVVLLNSYNCYIVNNNYLIKIKYR